MNAAINNMTIAQLKQELTAKGIKFSPKMKKDDLVNLLIQENEKQKPEEVEFPEAKQMENVEEENVENKENVDPMKKASDIIHEVLSAWGDLETMTRNILMNELREVMDEQFVTDNRKELLKLAVKAIQEEADKRANNNVVELERQPEEEVPVVVEEPVVVVAEEPAVVAEEPVAQVEKPKRKRATKVKKAEVVEAAEEVPAADAAVEEPVVVAEEPVAQAENPKRKRATKAKKAEEEVEKPNFEEMTLAQIREFLSSNGMEKQLEKLNALMTTIEKPKKEKKEKKERAPNHFNVFMSEEMASLKEQFPEMNHKERFTQAVANWKTSEKNPKNQHNE